MIESGTDSWKNVKLGDLFRIKHGFAFKGEFFADSGDYILLTPGNFQPQGGLKLKGDKEKFYSGDFPKDYLLSRGDLLVVMTDLTQEARILGSPAFINENNRYLHNQRLGKIVELRSSLIDSTFLYYIFNLNQVRGQIKGSATGATVRHTSPERILAVETKLPPLPIQKRVASMLSAYDSLIENNTRRIQILEEMARRIYEEWFVRFRFPGHEKVRMVESKLGLIPDGYEVASLGDLLEYHVGGGWGEEEQSDEFRIPAIVIRGTDIPSVRQGTLGKAPLRYHKPSNFQSRKLENGDIIFEVSGGSKDQPVGRAVLLSEQLLTRQKYPVICASFCRLIRTNKQKMLPELLLLHLQRIYDNREIMKYQTQSTGITNFKFTVFLKNEKLVYIPPKFQRKFADVALPFYRLAESLGIRNESLRRTRDLLLPKLMSGEIDVSDFPEPEAL
jgi:type I restriction enzyme, S subunit